MTLTWEDPPRQKRTGKAEVDEAVRQLQTRPGQWALVVENASSNRRLAYLRRGCEVRLHQISTDPQRVNVYARWPVEF